MILLSLDIGRFHPLVVHLPIGILFFALLLHFLSRWQRTDQYKSAIVLALATTVLGCLGAIASGWLLADGGGYDGETLDRHKWMGIATGLVALLMLFLTVRKSVHQNLISSLYLVSLALISFTGHLGGEMTHGSDYLFPPEPVMVEAENLENALVYPQLVRAILTEKCVACHSNTKQKGGLNMASMAGLLKGGDHGDILKTAEMAPAELMARILLPQSDEKHMPPKGKHQLTDEEIAILNWWIANGACDTCLAGSLTDFEEMLAILEKHLDPGGGVEPITDKQLAQLRENGIALSSLSETDPLIGLSLDSKKTISSREIDAIEEVATNVRYLSLSGSQLPEALIAVIAEMENLEQLLLPNSSLTDDDLQNLTDLPKLKVLNVYGTTISDASLPAFQALPALEKVYTWQSGLSENGVERLAEQRPELYINAGVNQANLAPSVLNPPTIVIEKAIFTDTATVAIESEFRNTTIRYTTDGTVPTEASPVYSQPIQLTQTTRLQAVTAKEGWQTSEPVAQLMLKASTEFAQVSLQSKPSPTYTANGPQTLIDRQRSEMGFGTGKWIGYQGENLVATLQLKKQQSIQSVYVSSMSEPRSWIFYPTGFEVSVSTDGKTFQPVGSVEVNREEALGVNTQDCFELAFAATQARYVRIAVQSRMKNPEWHTAPGEACWLFVDEILVE